MVSTLGRLVRTLVLIAATIYRNGAVVERCQRIPECSCVRDRMPEPDLLLVAGEFLVLQLT